MIVGQWSGVRCHTDCCRMPPVACRLLYAACCMPPVACRLLQVKAGADVHCKDSYGYGSCRLSQRRATTAILFGERRRWAV